MPQDAIGNHYNEVAGTYFTQMWWTFLAKNRKWTTDKGGSFPSVYIVMFHNLMDGHSLENLQIPIIQGHLTHSGLNKLLSFHKFHKHDFLW